MPYYPDDLDELILAEPAAPMRKRLMKAVRRSNRSATILDAAAERLPVDDGSVDTVVSTLVLCTVDRPAVVLDEIKRVLRPGGRLLFLEHVRADSAWPAAWQDCANDCTARLMLALYRAGREAEALEAYQHARGLLVEQLGIEPGRELRELEGAILAHDPDLALDLAESAGRPSRLRVR